MQKPDFSTLATYKAMKAIYLEDFLVRGRLRIGCLSDYRKIESDFEGIADPGEGYRLIDIPEFQSKSMRYGDLPHPLNQMGFMAQNAIAGFDILGCTADDHHRDVYVFSATASEDSGKALYPEGAGVRICNAIRFAEIVSQELNKRGLGTGEFTIGPCLYVPQVQDFRSLEQVPLAFQKERRFAAQKEFRFVWTPTSPPGPLTLEIAELTGLFKRAW